MQNLDFLVQQIIKNPLFVRLKTVVENIDGWHDHESVYDHLIATSDRAKQAVQGEFITNSDAKEEFSKWMEEDFHGTSRGDMAVLTALLHDCGKILHYRENGQEYSINNIKENGQTSCPGHEYWGSRLVAPKILEDVQVMREVKEHICHVIQIHDTFSTEYFNARKDWNIETLIQDMKGRANGYYEEALFNVYADCFVAPAFQETKVRVEEVFNTPTFYNKREYFIP